ncbi:MAG: HupE/UreJ family protein [Gammaproteobacteria bacterium]|nr:HupE/UreJ family protein [Gammaproteobacteria bacterium]
MTKSAITGVASLCGLGQLAVAHPGHDPLVAHADGLLHPLFGAEHVLLAAVIGGVVWLLGRTCGSGRRDGE